MLLVMVMASGCGPKIPQLQSPAMVMEDGSKPRSAKDWAVIAEDYEKKATQARQAERLARQRAIRAKLYWVVGICLFGAVLCVVGMLFVPGARKLFVYGAVGLVAVAAASWGLAAIVPYIGYIAAGVGVLIAGGGIYYWRADSKARDQIVQAIDTVKTEIPDYKKTFRTWIDKRSDKLIDKTRRRLGLS